MPVWLPCWTKAEPHRIGLGLELGRVHDGPPGQLDGAENAGVVAELGSHQVLRRTVLKGRRADISGQPIHEGRASVFQETGRFANTAAKDQAMRRQGQGQRRSQGSQIPALQLPSRMVRRQLLPWPPPPLVDRRARSQPFGAIPMERAASDEPVVRVARQGKVSHFRMDEPMHRSTVYHGSAADAGADGHIHQRREMSSCAPASLCQGRAVDVRIEADRRSKGGAQGSDQIGMGPSGLRCGGDVAPSRRRGIEIDRPEARNADGIRSAVPSEGRVKEIQDSAEAPIWRLGRNSDTIAQIVRPGADGANDLRPACFDRTQ